MQSLHGFTAVPDKLKQYVSKKLSRDDYVKLYCAVPNVTKTVEKIIVLNQKLRKEYLKALNRSPKSSHINLLKNAKAVSLQQRVTVLLNK